jgi:hypothetical protein
VPGPAKYRWFGQVKMVFLHSLKDIPLTAVIDCV